MGFISILFWIPAVVGIGLFLFAVIDGDAVKKRRNIMTATATATYKAAKSSFMLTDENAIHYLEYEFYAPEDCCNHTASSERFFPFFMVSKRLKKPVTVCYEPKHPTMNAIINKNGKIIRRPYQITFIFLGLLLIAFSVLLMLCLGK